MTIDERAKRARSGGEGGRTADRAIEPQAFGKYTLLSKIAAGGMAEVYRAKLVGVAGFEKVLALKRILPHFAADDGFVDMFVREANVAVRLAHSNIVQVFELGRVEDSYYIALEFVDGKDLKSVIRAANEKGRTIPPEISAWVVKEMCAGLHHAHMATDEAGKPLGIVHRDISPHNVLVSWGGEVKVADFGIAKLQSAQRNTRTGTLKGKLAYMSPEQSQGDPDLDARSDVFATGIVLYETLTGKRPFEADSDRGFVRAIQLEEPVPASKVAPGIPPELDVILAKALAKKREDRFADAAQMGRAIGAFLQRQASVTRSVEADDLASLMTELLGGRKTFSGPAPVASKSNGTPILDAAELQPTNKAALEVFAATAAPEGTSTVGRMKTGPMPAPGTITRPEARQDPTATRPSKRKAPLLALGGGGGVVLVIVAAVFGKTFLDGGTATNTATPIAATETPVATPTAAIAAASTGTLLVEGGPAGASVFVGDQRAGAIGEPLSVPLDTKEVTVAADWHRAQKVAVSFVDGKAAAKVALARGRGSLRIGVPRSGYTVKIPGVTGAGEEWARKLDGKPAGQYTAEISDGTKTVKATVVIKDGRETRMVIEEPLVAGRRYGP